MSEITFDRIDSRHLATCENCGQEKASQNRRVVYDWAAAHIEKCKER